MPQYHRLENKGKTTIAIVSAGNVNILNPGDTFEGIIDRIDLRSRDKVKFDVTPIDKRDIRVNDVNRANMSNELLISLTDRPTDEELKELKDLVQSWQPKGGKTNVDAVPANNDPSKG